MALRFDGATEALWRTTGVPDESNFTICGWARQIVDTDNWSILAAMEELGPTNWAYIGFDGTGTDLGAFGGGTHMFASSPAIDTWFFWAMTCAGPSTGQLIGYWALLADVSLTATTGGDTNVFTGQQLWIGNNGFDERFNGRIAAVKVWDAVLTPTELLAERGTFVVQRAANLHAWLPMVDPVVADNALDQSGNGRHFTITGTLTIEDGPPIPFGSGGPSFPPYSMNPMSKLIVR